MRLLTFALPAALLGLMLAAGPALASLRSGPAPAGHSTSQARAPAAKARAGASLARTQPRVQQAAWRPGAAPAACGRKAKHCRSASLVRAAPFAWTQGLPPAAQVQANECPDGTMATLASGHDDVVRCMPI
jgi:hypothetical protein